MRRTNETNPETLKLLKEGAAAAQTTADTVASYEKKLQMMQEQVRMVQYAVMNMLKTLNNFPQIQAQLEQLDYRTLGVISALKQIPALATDISLDERIEACATQARTEAFDELSKQDDEKNSLVPLEDEDITLEHVVIFTSKCEENPDQGVFRSKINLSDAAMADTRDNFVGKRVGSSFTAKFGVHDHLVTILGARKKTNATSDTQS
jgi:hypothetical protein